jgi:MFS family permease
MGDADRPTRARYTVLGYLGALSFVLYLDRVCIGKAATAIKTELDLSESQMGVVFGAFTLAYGLFEVITGHWGDRYGSRPVLIRIVLWWSLFTALTGCVGKFSWQVLPGLVVNSFLLLLVVRFLFGAGEAGALPNMARIISRWFPLSERGAAQAVLNTSMLIGGAAAPIASAYLIEAVGWRWTFAIFGSLGVIWAGAFRAWFCDDPAKHSKVNPAELRHITSSALQGDLPSHGTQQVPWGQVLTTPTIWLMGTVMACAAFYTYMLYSWFPRYLEAGRGVTSTTAGWLAGGTLIGGAFGSVLGGWLCDRFGKGRGRGSMLRTIGAGGLALSGACAGTSIFLDAPVLSSVLLSVALFGVALEVSAWWGAMADIAGQHVGALFGLCNSMGIAGAFASQVFLGWYVDLLRAGGHEGRAAWDPAFPIYSAVLFAGAACWPFITIRRKG